MDKFPKKDIFARFLKTNSKSSIAVQKKIIWEEPDTPRDIPLLEAAIEPLVYEQLLEEGWWHLDRYLWRTMYDFEWSNWEKRVKVMHLRFDLEEFRFSQSQRKLFKKNADLYYIIQPLEYITPEKQALFFKHVKRFKHRAPHSILEMTPIWTGEVNMAWECLVFKEEELVACSFFDMTPGATASIYAMYDPELGNRSLGLLTMCIEIQHAIQHGHHYFYPGYTHFKPSHMDYKKQFHNTEFFDWEKGLWLPVGRDLVIKDGFFERPIVEQKSRIEELLDAYPDIELNT